MIGSNSATATYVQETIQKHKTQKLYKALARLLFILEDWLNLTCCQVDTCFFTKNAKRYNTIWYLRFDFIKHPTWWTAPPKSSPATVQSSTQALVKLTALKILLQTSRIGLKKGKSLRLLKSMPQIHQQDKILATELAPKTFQAHMSLGLTMAE